MKSILVGAVAYDPRVVQIWDIIKEFFEQQGRPIDYVFYSNYEMLVDGLIGGHIDIAWNSPLAWLDAQRRTGGTCRAIAMRDTDRDRVSHLLVRQDSGIRSVSDLRGKTVATGASDSPQATLIPLNMLARDGLAPETDFQVRRFEVAVGKHGDHVGGELNALGSLLNGESDACAVLDLNWDRWATDGTADPAKIRVLATTRKFDHCNFTVTDRFSAASEEQWKAALFSMSYSNPLHQEMMDLEGLKEWLPGRTIGYAELDEAVQRFHFFDATRSKENIL
ncbi:MAG TPA: PhnD/SsuA/transferrin family substrate-binding protein [Armatimonadota bacterium]|nr:PhnD/SsuA/transferrin family substrate-binding protein [Armatimonadota bacterium]